MKSRSRLCLSSTFGMTEMEVAAVLIIERCEAKGTWVTPITLDLFTTHDHRNGFLHLIHRGFLKHQWRKGFFYVNKDFLDRVFDKLPDISLPNQEPTSDEISNLELPMPARASVGSAR